MGSVPELELDENPLWCGDQLKHVTCSTQHCIVEKHSVTSMEAQLAATYQRLRRPCAALFWEGCLTLKISVPAVHLGGTYSKWVICTTVTE